jgi:hypothetical protein
LHVPADTSLLKAQTPEYVNTNFSTPETAQFPKCPSYSLRQTLEHEPELDT